MPHPVLLSVEGQISLKPRQLQKLQLMETRSLAPGPQDTSPEDEPRQLLETKKAWLSTGDLLGEENLAKFQKATSFFEDIKELIGLNNRSEVSSVGDPACTSPSPSRWSTLSLSSKCPESKAQVRTATSSIVSSSSQNPFVQVQQRFKERGDKLGETEEETFKLMHGAQGFAMTASILKQQAESQRKAKKQRKNHHFFLRKKPKSCAEFNGLPQTGVGGSLRNMEEQGDQGEVLEVEKEPGSRSVPNTPDAGQRRRKSLARRGMSLVGKMWNRIRHKKPDTKMRAAGDEDSDDDDVPPDPRPE